MDSHAWEADLRAIRAGTAPRHELYVRFLATRSQPVDPPPEPDGWLEVFEDLEGRRPLVRVPVVGEPDLSIEPRPCAVVGWPAPGRGLALVEGTARPAGPAYPLLPTSRLSRPWLIALLATPPAMLAGWLALFGLTGAKALGLAAGSVVPGLCWLTLRIGGPAAFRRARALVRLYQR